MDKFRNILIFLILWSASSISCAAWRKDCLQECFATHHDCDYCAYQCEITDHKLPVPNYDGDTICPFSPYDPYDDV